MGFFISKLKETKLNEYIGSKTMYSCADNGAFNSVVSEDLMSYADNNPKIMTIVDKNGVDHFLKVLRSGGCSGRDISKFADIIEEKYKDGFMMTN